MLSVFKWELRKTLFFPMLWIFFILCLIFNFISSTNLGYKGSYSNYVSDTSKELGIVIDEDFYDNLGRVEGSENSYFKRLFSETNSINDVFDNYEMEYVSKKYIDALGVNGTVVADKLREKYILIQDNIEEKAASDESQTLFFAGDTYSKYWYGLATTINTVLLEGMILSSLIVLMIVGFEQMSKTEDVVYSTYSGRGTIKVKLIAGLIVSISVFIILSFITLGYYFYSNGYQHIWNSSISSQFNYINDIVAGQRPFVTWNSYTVLTYTLASLGVSILIVSFISLLSFSIELIMKNTYLSFILVVIINGILAIIAVKLPNTMVLKYIISISPIWLYFQSNIWFTDGMYNLWPHFETIGSIVSLLIMVFIAFVSLQVFRRRNLT